MKLKKGDYGFIIPGRVLKSDFSSFNLTGYAVKLKVWAKGASTPLWTLDGNVTDAIAGKVEFTVLDTHFTQVGVFFGEIELIQAGHIESTNSFRIDVLESV